ncbi:MAG: hypothetical protein JWL77_1502 [Chthonomonadaceae bacterium]|nr:hypothetical protein [Chthonomonadaceae bacterium]
MAQATLNRVLEEIKTLDPAELRLVEAAVQSQLEEPTSGRPATASTEGNAWDVLEELMGTVTAPADWSEEHDHYLSGTPKRRSGNAA